MYEPHIHSWNFPPTGGSAHPGSEAGSYFILISIQSLGLGTFTHTALSKLELNVSQWSGFWLHFYSPGLLQFTAFYSCLPIQF